jgi:hypothetical protein
MVKRKTTAQFIQDARKVHGDKYDYSLVDYIDTKTRVKIICPVHGIFHQAPGIHLSGCGCAKCAGRLKTTTDFVKDARLIHGDKYDYSLVEYVAGTLKVKIVCSVHGVFEQSPSSHKAGRGCPICATEKKGSKKRRKKLQFIEDARLIHGDKYDYSLVECVTGTSKVKIICPVHGVFEQSPSSHIWGRECPDCYSYGKLIGKPGILYLIQFQKDFALFWKIGFTCRAIEDRFPRDALFINSYYLWQFEQVSHAYNVEQSILKRFQDYKFPRILFPLLEDGGDTECFTPNLPYKKAIAAIEREIKALPV